jgi:hypothetical protein
MKQNIKDFKESLLELDLTIKNHYISKGISEGDFIYDGIIDIEEYYSSSIKILWILKEPYSGSKRSMLDDLKFNRAEGNKKDSHTTWHPIIYISHCIINNFCDYSSIKKIKEDKRISNVLKKIAFINVQKTPEKERTNPKSKRTNPKDISEAYKKHKEILHTQINVYNPDIIIGASTLPLFINDLGLKDEDKIKLHWTKNNKLYINTYHPAQLVLKPDDYITRIISISKFWFETKYLKK